MSHISNGYYHFMYSYDLKYDVLDDNGNRRDTRSYQRFKSYFTRSFKRQSHEDENAFRGDAYGAISTKLSGWINRLQQENDQRLRSWMEKRQANPRYQAPRPERRRYYTYNQTNVEPYRPGARGSGMEMPRDSEGRLCDPRQNQI